jgi:hypothetical protein
VLLPDGTWVLGPGDRSPEIRKIKGFLRVKFASYAGHLADTEVYDQELFLVVCEVQRRYNLPVTGYIGYSLKVRMGYLKPEPPVKPALHTVCGTGVRGDVGPDADVGRYLKFNLGVCEWWWTGYPAAPFPMWGSILAGVNQLITDISLRSQPGTPLWACGYSQGAIVWSLVYKYHMLPTGGVLHHRLPDLKRAFMFCNPMREENVGGPWAGALEDRLVNTPPWWREYAHPKDIYTSVPVEDGWGENIRAITKIIMGNNWWAGRDSIFAQLLEIGINPFTEGWAAFQALMNAGLFFGARTGPHVQGLPVAAAIDHLRAA